MAQWFVAAKKADFNKAAKEFNIDPVTARIIRNRDVVGDGGIRKYLMGGKEDMYPAELLKDMDKTVAILRRKIDEKAKIRVIGDYDADGICSAYILTKGLTACGADTDTVIPHRVKDGYGLNESLIEDAYKDKVDTIVTCDNGIAAAAEIAYAKKLGITVLITDHHEIPYEEDEKGIYNYIIPEAEAIINPKQEDCTYPYKNICGAVVAYKLISSMYKAVYADKEQLPEEFIEIAAFATVCDVMELRDENRIIVKCGLESMRNTGNIGLKALMEVCGLEGRKLTAYHIGFVLGPCINATGRLDTAKRAFSLLMSQKRSEAVEIAAELKNLNDSRKEMTLRGVEEAVSRIEGTSMMKDKVLIVYMPECHESLAGIIAGRIREKYGKPVFILTRGEEEVKGSARSIENYHIYEEMTRCKDLFIKYGGHKMAAGLTMKEENIEAFRKKINKNCRLTKEDFEEKVHIDAAMPLSYITKKLINELELLEPFGVGNTKPVFALRGIHLLNEKIMGKNRNVAKYTVKDENGSFYEIVFFGELSSFHKFLSEKAGEEKMKKLKNGEQTDITIAVTYYPTINSYGGREEIQIVMLNYK